jgi:hypothetical protein
MLSNWLTLRQAQEALKNGRLDEAYRLASQPEVQGHKRAGEILQQAGRALLKRAQLHLQHDDTAAAWKDLIQAEAAGSQDQAVVRLRQELILRGLGEMRALLEAGQPGRAAEAATHLRAYGVQQPQLKVLEDVARGWSLALELAGKGEMGQAVSALERMSWLVTERFKPLEEFRHGLERRRGEFEALLAKLYAALEQANWREVIRLADEVLAVAPQHAEARKARARAWKSVEPPTLPVAPAPNGQERKQEPARAEEPPRRLMLWIDGVGGYLLCLSNRVSLGQAMPDAYVDIPIQADVSRLHGYLTRDTEGYLLEAVRPITVNHQPVDKALLRDGDRLTLGNNCQMRFSQPLAVSTTARLELASGHRLSLALEGVILMAETCILGPAGEGHIVIPDLRRPVVLFRHKDRLGVSASGEWTVDGRRCRDRATIEPHSTVAAEDFRFTVEAIGSQLGKSRS